MSENSAKKMPPNTRDFVVAAKEKGGTALSELFKRIHDRLFRFCVYLTGNVELARDLTQEAYVKVLENLESLEDPDHLVGWLFTVTRNQFLDYIKSPRNSPKKQIEELGNVLVMKSVSKDWVSGLCKQLARLSPEDRYLLLLVCLEGHSYKEAAALMGTSEESVRGKISRLRKTFDRKEFFTGQVDLKKK